MSFLWGCSYKQRKIAVGFQTQASGTGGSSIVDDGGGVYVLQLDWTSANPSPSRTLVLEPDGTPAIDEYLWGSHYVKCTDASDANTYGIFAMFAPIAFDNNPCLAMNDANDTLHFGKWDNSTGTFTSLASAAVDLSTWKWVACRWKASTKHYEIWVDDTKEIDHTEGGTLATAVDMNLWSKATAAQGKGAHVTFRFKDSLMNDEDESGITGRPTKDDYSYALLLPDGDYVNDDFEDEGAGTTDIYQSIDEIPVSGADYIVGGIRYRADFGAASPGEGKQVRAVIAYDDRSGNETTTTFFEAALGAGAAWTGPDLDAVTGGDAYNYLNTPGQWNMKDANGTPWTTALYNTLNLGLISATEQHHDGLALDVLYGPETAPPAARRIFTHST